MSKEITFGNINAWGLNTLNSVLFGHRLPAMMTQNVKELREIAHHLFSPKIRPKSLFAQKVRPKSKVRYHPRKVRRGGKPLPIDLPELEGNLTDVLKINKGQNHALRERIEFALEVKNVNQRELAFLKGYMDGDDQEAKDVDFTTNGENYTEQSFQHFTMNGNFFGGMQCPLAEPARLANPRNLSLFSFLIHVKGMDRYVCMDGYESYKPVWENVKMLCDYTNGDDRIEIVSMPVRDFSAHTVEQALQICEWVDESRKSGLKTVFSCSAGFGRTGFAMWLVAWYEHMIDHGGKPFIVKPPTSDRENKTIAAFIKQIYPNAHGDDSAADELFNHYEDGRGRVELFTKRYNVLATACAMVYSKNHNRSHPVTSKLYRELVLESSDAVSDYDPATWYFKMPENIIEKSFFLEDLDEPAFKKSRVGGKGRKSMSKKRTLKKHHHRQR